MKKTIVIAIFLVSCATFKSGGGPAAIACSAESAQKLLDAVISGADGDWAAAVAKVLASLGDAYACEEMIRQIEVKCASSDCSETTKGRALALRPIQSAIATVLAQEK